jgi:hypothetical protein
MRSEEGREKALWRCAADVAVVVLLVGGVCWMEGSSGGVARRGVTWGDEGGRLSGLRVVDGGGEGGSCWGTVVHSGRGCLYRAGV